MLLWRFSAHWDCILSHRLWDELNEWDKLSAHDCLKWSEIAEVASIKKSAKNWKMNVYVTASSLSTMLSVASW